MLRNYIQQVRDRFGSVALPRGAFGYNILDANGIDRTVDLTYQLVDDEGYAWTRNRVVDQGLVHLLNASLRGESVLSAWFIAPYVANVTPAANLTAANFNSSLTEFTNYSEATRPAWTSDGAATSAALLENATAPALFTIGAGAQTSIQGAGLLSVSGKAATSGICFAAQKRATALAVEEGFEIRIKYRVTATSS